MKMVLWPKQSSSRGQNISLKNYSQGNMDVTSWISPGLDRPHYNKLKVDVRMMRGADVRCE